MCLFVLIRLYVALIFDVCNKWVKFISDNSFHLTITAKIYLTLRNLIIYLSVTTLTQTIDVLSRYRTATRQCAIFIILVLKANVLGHIENASHTPSDGERCPTSLAVLKCLVSNNECRYAVSENMWLTTWRLNRLSLDEFSLKKNT